MYNYAEFADPPPPLATPIAVSDSVHAFTTDEEIVPTINVPSTLMDWAVLILNTPNPTLKVWSFQCVA